MSTALSNPSVFCNNQLVPILPESLKFKIGGGVQKVRSQTAGGNVVIPVTTVDMTTKLGMVSFDLIVNMANAALFSTWKYNPGANIITLVQVGQTPLVFNNMSCTSDPDFEASSNGKVNISFEGSPAIGY